MLFILIQQLYLYIILRSLETVKGVEKEYFRAAGAGSLSTRIGRIERISTDLFFEGDGRDRWDRRDEGLEFNLCPLCPFCPFCPLCPFRVSLPTRASTLQGEVFGFVVGFSRACFLSFRKPKTLPRRVDALVSQKQNQIPAFTRKPASAQLTANR